MMNISTHGHSRFQEKLDKFFWFAVMILPLLFWLFLNVGRAFVPAKAEEESGQTFSSVYSRGFSDYDYYLVFSDVVLDVSDTVYGTWSAAAFYNRSMEYPLSFNYCVTETMEEVENCLSFYLPYDSSSIGTQLSMTYLTQRVKLDTVEVLNFINFHGFEFNLSDNIVFYEPFSSWYISNSSNDYYFYLRTGSTLILQRVPVVDSSAGEETFDYLTLDYVMTDYFGMDIESAPVSIIGDVFNGIFAKDGIFPFFKEDSGLTYYFIYFVIVQIIHVLIDVLVFIPRFAHKVLSKAIDFGG